jgi:hypothetical protein
MNIEDKKKIEELQKQIQCEKQFECTKIDLDSLCKARHHFEFNELECMAETDDCSFAVNNPPMRICTCPLRKFIAVNLSKWTTIANQMKNDI